MKKHDILFIILLIALLAMSLNAFSQNQKNTQPEIRRSPIEEILEQQHRMMQEMLNDFFDREFFDNNRDPFAEMNRMREKFRKHLKTPQGNELDEDFNNVFDDWYGDRFGGSISEITQDEDEKFIYYKLDIKNIDKNSLNIKVEDGLISISGETKIEKEESSDNRTTKIKSASKFARSIPVPANTDPNKVDISSANDQVILKFPKTTKSFPKSDQLFKIQGGKSI